MNIDKWIQVVTLITCISYTASRIQRTKRIETYLISFTWWMVLSFILGCALVGCSTPKPQLVEFNCPTIELPPDPPEQVKKLSTKSTPDVVMKAWVLDAKDYKEWDRVVRDEVAESKT